MTIDGRDARTERHGHPVRALGDGAGERAAVCLIGVAMFALALIGMYVSFQTVYEYVHPWFGDTAWAVPIAIDVAILVFSAADLLLSFWRMAKPSMRLVPWGFTAATIWLNWQAGGPVPIRIAHAAMPALWVLFCEYARHVLAARVGLVTGARMENVRRSRWLLAPLSTARLRRRMILWEITSYRRALELEAERRTEIARLETRHGRGWRRRASAHERLALRLSAVAPADALPSLTAALATPGANATALANAQHAPAPNATNEADPRTTPGVTVGAGPQGGAALGPQRGTSLGSGAEVTAAQAREAATAPISTPHPRPAPAPADAQHAPAPASVAGSAEASGPVDVVGPVVRAQVTHVPEPKFGHPAPSAPPSRPAARGARGGSRAPARNPGSARRRAVALLADEPDMPGTELARRLGVTTGYGRRLRSELLNATDGYR